MLGVNIWVRNPYPFRYEEYSVIQDVLKRIYGGNPVYLKEWPVDYVSVDDVNITTARKMADTVKALHLHAALKDKAYGSYGASSAPSLLVEVDVRGQGDARPEWAKPKPKENQS